MKSHRFGVLMTLGCRPSRVAAPRRSSSPDFELLPVKRRGISGTEKMSSGIIFGESSLLISGLSRSLANRPGLTSSFRTTKRANVRAPPEDLHVHDQAVRDLPDRLDHAVDLGSPIRAPFLFIVRPTCRRWTQLPSSFILIHVAVPPCSGEDFRSALPVPLAAGVPHQENRCIDGIGCLMTSSPISPAPTSRARRQAPRPPEVLHWISRPSREDRTAAEEGGAQVGCPR